MQFSLFTSFVVVCVLGVAVNARYTPEVSEDDNEEGYYWRDFAGVVPKDALTAGRNVHGRPTYIGQVLHVDKLLPAKIDPQAKKVLYEWGFKELTANKNVKVLCTKHPEQFEWLNTGSRRINNITDVNFVDGGYQEGATILIGRKQLDDELSVGKVVFTKKQSTLSTTKDGVAFQHLEFEVLTYNPNIKVVKQRKSNLEYKSSNNEHDNESGQNVFGLNCDGKSIIVNIFNK